MVASANKVAPREITHDSLPMRSVGGSDLKPAVKVLSPRISRINFAHQCTGSSNIAPAASR